MKAFKFTNLQYIIFLVILVLVITSFSLRTFQSYTVEDSQILSYVGSDDPMYNLRQIENMLSNYPTYQHFDPMTLFPYGQYLNWGPMLTWLCATACLLFGAVTRPEIIRISLYIPPLLAALTIPIVYLFGRKLYGWKVGIASAIFTTIVFGQFYTRSMYGYLDHHIAEVFFGMLFLLVYIYTVEHLRNDSRIPIPTCIALSVNSGIAFMLGLLVMPTMLLFSLIVALYTPLQLLIDSYEKKNSLYLVVLNAVTFGLFGNVVMFIYNDWSPVLTLVNYSFAHSIVYTLLAVGTCVLYLIKDDAKINPIIKEKPLYFVGAVIVSVMAALILMPQSWKDFVDGGVRGFFGTTSLSLTVQEARGWTIQDAFNAFNFGLILFALGVIVLLYYMVKEKKPIHLLTLVWIFVITFSTWQHIRYEYYMAIPVAIIAGLFVGDVFEYRGKELYNDINKVISDETIQEKTTRRERRSKKISKTKKSSFGVDRMVGIGFVVFSVAMSFMFIYTSASSAYTITSYGSMRMNPDWRNSLEWFGENTPDTGIDYYKIYDSNSFNYPEQSYGVMSWWDYGHLITYISKRIPNSNPFQAGVAGANGSAAFFMSETESDVLKIANNIGTRYVITDIEMSFSKFWAMATWYNSTLGVYPYQNTIYIPSGSVVQSGQSSMVLTDKYYRTVVSRLHNYDGSYVPSGGTVYLELDSTDLKNTKYPAVKFAQKMNYEDALKKKDDYNLHSGSQTSSIIVSENPNLPACDLDALENFRLIYESQTTVGGSETNPMKYVKIFERVDGHTVNLQPGFVELQIKTNTGRIFSYIQKSDDGIFVLPYSTVGCEYETAPMGKYHLVGTDIYFDVSEDQLR